MAIGELADGLEIDLNKVPKKYEGLDGTELAISESQERMAVVLAPQDAEAFCAAAAEENLNAQVVAVVTESPRLKMEWRGDTIVNIARAFLNTNGVTQRTDVEIEAPDPDAYYRKQVPECLKGKRLAEAFQENLARLEVCCQKGLAERFDASIGAATVLMPFAGKYQLTPEEAMVAKLPVIHGGDGRRHSDELWLHPRDCALLTVPRGCLRRRGEPFQALCSGCRPAQLPPDLPGIF